MSSPKCAIIGCTNSKQKNPEKYFFTAPSRSGERRQGWMKPTGKWSLASSTAFYVCEDHFDMDSDVEFFRMNGAPSLYKTVHPHRNLTSPEMALQAKLDKINWKCFVPSCENKRLMSDRNVVFFAVPEGLQGQLWRAAVFEDKGFTNGSSVSDLEFCCEDHFDITKDFSKRFSTGTSIEYTINAGKVPSLNLSDSKLDILDNVKLKRLADMNIHPRVILNNRLSYLYGSKLPLLIENLQTTDPSFVAVKEEPIELNETAELKTEPIDAAYEYEYGISNELVRKAEKSCSDTNPLELETEPKYKPEPEASSGSEENNDDSDVTTDNNLSTDDESFEPDTSDSSTESEESEGSEYSESLEDEARSEGGSDLNATERFECRYCLQLVQNLDRHVERIHWNFSKNVNRTRCGLCPLIYPRSKDLRRHQIYVHSGNAYACDICDSLARTHEAIRIHILREHSSERTMLCQHCGKSYKFIWQLKRHVRNIHIGVEKQRTHACQHCEKMFFSSTDMTKHVNSVHLNLRPYKCDVDGCNKAFKQPFHLKAHHAQELRTANS
ncbi:hypothetical protein HA402_005532 [Bradysia odoriphaga]|nr:hypothetical protein HA402_005532 [Bradysia odoriphaga]